MRNRLLSLVLLAFFLASCSDSATTLASPPTGGDFVLQAASGPLDSTSLRGKVLLLYFGYINCPDVCPPSLAIGASALKSLTVEERSRTRMIMISVDPERDTPSLMKDYAAYFHPEMIGVTGTIEDIAAVAKKYGAGYFRQPARADGSYAVDHTSITYVVGPDGKLKEALPLGTPADKVVASIRKLL